ncbi:LOW QUALITY PROTEIN: zinc finger and BTB domain-containing protein 40 [Phaethornis superciliosus]
MELPSYSKQLLQQLCALWREQQFCDCTICIGMVHFRAHEVVLLFKSLLDSTDTISIDASLVTPEEFALLLEMMYRGKLPLGKHNFTKVISLADSLQMFDVAVSCKNLLGDLIRALTQDQVESLASEVSGQATHSSGNPTEANNLPQSGKPTEEKTDILQRVSRSPGTREAETEADEPPPGLELLMNRACLPQDVLLSDSRSLWEDSCPVQPGCAEQGGHAGEEKGGARDLAAERKICKLDFFLQYESVLSEALSDAQTVLKRLEECREMDASQKEALVTCLAEVGEQSVSKVTDTQTLDAQTLLSLLKLFEDTNHKLKAALLVREQSSGEALQQIENTDEGALTTCLLGCKEELIQSVTQLSPIVKFLEAAEEGFLTTLEKQVVLDCCEGSSEREAMVNLLRKVNEEKMEAESLVKLLGAVKAPFPGLHLLLDNLVATGDVSDGKAKCSPEDYEAKLLRQYRENLVELLTDTQTLLQGISTTWSLAPAKREVMEQVLKHGVGDFASLVALEEQSLSVSAVWQLPKPAPLNLLMEEIQKQPRAEFFSQASNTFIFLFSESTAIEIILWPSKLISEQRAELEGLAPGEAGLPEALKELLSISAQKESSEASLKAAQSTAQEKYVLAIKICQLLCNVHEYFPDLQPLMLGHVGLLTEGRERKKAGIRKWKVNCELVEALEKDEDKGDASAKESKEPQEKASSRKSFVCKACEKNFHFYCLLRVHMKRCWVARGKQIQCQESSEVKSAKEELGNHQLEVHGVVGTTKKQQQPAAASPRDICGWEFAHSSGMQYHKLTEHFDEKPFSCEQCGAKFAATLKNHVWLQTGDWPCSCKHCLMSLMQASALAYHTKKQHAEGEPSPQCGVALTLTVPAGKLYACQCCSAGFAQSIAHTGNKPYICQECGKGFLQANGVSVHLQTFHNTEDPYDCKKSSLQEHQNHIHEAHSQDYHPCPKVFSAPSLLECPVVTHVGGKPFNCGVCDKAYQQLSGLWYHNRSHHPDVFAAQNHHSSKFSSLQCSSCDKTFSSTAAHQNHIKAEHTDVKFHECKMCKELFPMALLQVHVKCKHSENTFTCELYRELLPSQGDLEGHYSREHPKVIFSQAITAQIVQVIQMSEQEAADSQIFVMLPESQMSQAGSELVAVTMEDLFDDKVTICEETK